MTEQERCLRHKWTDGWVCEKCGLKYADYVELRKEKGRSGTPFPRLRRVNRDIELVTELILRNDTKDAPIRTVRHGKWHECIIPIGKDHVAYLTLPDGAFREIREVWEGAQA